MSNSGQIGPVRKLVVAGVAALTVLTAVTTVTDVQPVHAEETNAPVDSLLCGAPGDITVRLYRLFFNRQPDAAGLEYWSGIYNQTQSAATVAFWMAKSPEYTSLWDGTTNADYVEGLLYDNLLDRPSEPGGFAYWVSLLDGTAVDGAGNPIPAIERDDMSVFWVVQPELTRKHPVVEPSDCSVLDDVVDITGGRAVEFDYLTTDLKASATRCSGVSINANWVHRDGRTPFSEHIGFANIDGVNLPSRGPSPGIPVNANTVFGDDNSRGIFGARIKGSAGDRSGFDHRFNTNIGFIEIMSPLVEKDGSVLQLHANYWDDNPAGQWFDASKFANKTDGWEWAVGGISMVVNGDYNVETAGQDYTFNTTRHSFVAFKAPSTVMIGATTQMTAHQMVTWLMSEGYTDIMKMDGGGSVEMTEGFQTTVAGTNRPLPVWLGTGC